MFSVGNQFALSFSIITISTPEFGYQVNAFFEIPYINPSQMAEAFLALTLARIIVFVLSFRIVSRSLGEHMKESGMMTDDVSARKSMLVGQAIRSAANNTPWQSVCLPQAIAGQWMLRRRNIPATVYFGVMKSPGSTDNLTAHAWLRCGPRIITGADGHLQFTVVSTFATQKRNV